MKTIDHEDLKKKSDRFSKEFAMFGYGLANDRYPGYWVFDIDGGSYYPAIVVPNGEKYIVRSTINGDSFSADFDDDKCCINLQRVINGEKVNIRTLNNDSKRNSAANIPSQYYMAVNEQIDDYGVKLILSMSNSPLGDNNMVITFELVDESGITYSYEFVNSPTTEDLSLSYGHGLCNQTDNNRRDSKITLAMNDDGKPICCLNVNGNSSITDIPTMLYRASRSTLLQSFQLNMLFDATRRIINLKFPDPNFKALLEKRMTGMQNVSAISDFPLIKEQMGLIAIDECVDPLFKFLKGNIR